MKRLLVVLTLAAAPLGAQPSRLDRELDSLMLAAPTDYHGVMRRLRQMQQQIRDSLGAIEKAQKQTVDSLGRLLSPKGAVAIVAGASAIGHTVGRLDRDPGGYRDSFRGHDKIAHAAVCSSLYAAMRSVGAPRWLAYAAPVIAGVALEVGQGHGSGMDLVANNTGCWVALTFDLTFNRRLP